MSDTPIGDELRGLGLHTLGDDPAPEAVEAFLRRWAGSPNGADPLRITLQRQEIIKAGIKAGVVDAALRSYAPDKETEGSGSTPFFAEPSPWPDPVDGKELLTDLTDSLKRFLSLPAGCDTALALWTVHAHAHDAADVSPVLAITSPEKRCGKTTLLEVLSAQVPRPLPASNMTSAVIFRAVEKFGPTLLVDEADTFLTRNDELRGVLNSGHRRSMATVIRAVGEDFEPRVFRTWSPKVVALIGRLPDTLADRSIEIRMRRRAADEEVERLRIDRLEELNPLCRRTCRWVQDHIDEIRTLDPPVPDGLHDRAADNWRPLLAIADHVGGTWPTRAREAALALSESSGAEDASIRTQLLEDLQEIFGIGSIDRLPSKDIVSALTKREGRPWPEYRHGKPITPSQLARLLEPFGVRPKALWISGRTLRGYLREDFIDPFRRYLPDTQLQEAQECNPDASYAIPAGCNGHDILAPSDSCSDPDSQPLLRPLHVREEDPQTGQVADA
jgi:putative DNA primase/helicase